MKYGNYDIPDDLIVEEAMAKLPKSFPREKVEAELAKYVAAVEKQLRESNRALARQIGWRHAAQLLYPDNNQVAHEVLRQWEEEERRIAPRQEQSAGVGTG